MNYSKRLILHLLFVWLIAAAAAFPQTGLVAIRANVVDGRTVEVLTANGQELTVRLRMIGVPGQDDPLAETVKNHLATHLAKGEVTLVELRLEENVFVAGVFAKGVDLSMQMLRDGAAWHTPSKRHLDRGCLLRSQ